MREREAEKGGTGRGNRWAEKLRERDQRKGEERNGDKKDLYAPN